MLFRSTSIFDNRPCKGVPISLVLFGAAFCFFFSSALMQLGNRKIVGTVGELQYEVIQYRLEHEYGAKCRFDHRDISKACWITAEDPKKLAEFVRLKGQNIAQDKDENYVFLAESDWILRMNIQNNPDIEFHFTSEFKRK